MESHRAVMEAVEVTKETPRSPGLAHLALTVFVQSWNRGGEGAAEHLRRYAQSQQAYWHFSQCAYDARCLLEAPLTPDELELLWCWCADGNYRPSLDGLSGREWMEIVYSITARHGDAAVVEHLGGARDRAVTALVESVVERFEPSEGYSHSSCPIPTESARGILRTLLHSGYPDLTLRIFLVLAVAYYMRIPAALFRDISRAADALGYPDHLLEDIDALVPPADSGVEK
jgi:hypothetical protein